VKRNYGVQFLGIGSALPSKVVTNTDLEKLFDTNDEWIYSRTGIRERRVIDKGESSLSLALEASQQALKNSKLNPEDIDLIIVCTATPDMLYPSVSCMLQGELGACKAVSFDLSAACSGFIFGLVTASQYIYSGAFKNVLVVGVDVHSRFLDWSERSVSILFGDGAGAIVLSSCDANNDELLGFVIKSESDKKLDLTLSNNNVHFADLSKNIEANFVRMNGKAIYQFAVDVVPRVVNELLEKTSVKSSDIDYFVPHQANKRIIDMAAKKLGFDESKVISNIDKVGNTSAASIPLAIHQAILNKQIKFPCTMVLVGFGAGLTWGSALVKLNLKSV